MTVDGAIPRRERAAPLQLLADRDFRLVWLSGALAGIMRWLDMLAVAVYVLEVTGSALYVAMALFLRMVPMLLFGAFAGAIAEMVDRRKLLIGSLLVLSAVYLLLFWLAASGALELWQLAMGVALSGFFWALEFPVRRTMIAEIGGLDRIGATMGLDSSTNNFTRMLGPFVGGGLYELFGIQGTLLLGAGLYLLAALLLLIVATQVTRGNRKAKSILVDILEGLRFIRGHSGVAAVLVITIVLNMCGFSFVSMVPVIAKEELGLTPFPTGVLMSAEGAGAFMGALTIAFLAPPRHFNRLFLGGSLLYLCCIVVFSLSTIFWVSLPTLLIGGCGVAGFAAMQSALIIANSPLELRNRVMGVLAMCIGVGPIGILILGLLADSLGAATAVRIMSLTGLAAMIAAAFVWPEMRRTREAPPG